jgi:DNA-binding MarR family transcriptional regulator
MSMLLHEIDRVGRRVVRYANDLLVRHGLTFNQALVVLTVVRTEGRSPGEIGRDLDFDSATLAGLLRRLEHAGFISRERNAADGRSVVVRPTPAARRLQAAIRTALEDLDERLRRSLPARSANELAGAHARILNELP